MKKLLTISLTITFLLNTLSLSFAQTNAPDSTEENQVEIQIQQEDIEEAYPVGENSEQQDSNAENDETQDEQEPLAEQLETEEIQSPQYSFWTILGAILIPSTFLIIAYFILKFFQT